MLSLVQRARDGSAVWPALFRLCAVLWLAATVDMGLGVVYSLRYFHSPAQAWDAAVAGEGTLTAGATLAVLLLAACTLVFTCWRLLLLRRWAAITLGALGWYGVLQLLLEVRTGATYLLSTAAVLLTVSMVCGWSHLREDG